MQHDLWDKNCNLRWISVSACDTLAGHTMTPKIALAAGKSGRRISARRRRLGVAAIVLAPAITFFSNCALADENGISFWIPGLFGSLAWLNLRHVHVLGGCENLPRIAFIELPAHRAFISFPTSDASSFSHGSVRLQFGDFVFHSPGERIHQRSDGAGQWGLLSLPSEQLAACAKALTGDAITSPSEGRVLRPAPSDAKRLLRFHSKSCRLAESRQRLISNPEVGRALEQELLHGLVHCLMADDACNSRRRRRHRDIMVRFETALSERGDLQLNVPLLCKTIGVPERTLRECCKEFLGMSPTRYQLLRRLNLTRSALRRADPQATSVAEIARNHHFLELGRFAVAYRAVFGEMPSATLRRSN